MKINTQIIQYLNTTFGYNLSTDYYDIINIWRAWWQGFYKPFHRIISEDGKHRRQRDMYTMKMAKKVCEDWASILINDKTFVKIDDDYTQRFLLGDTCNGGVFGSNNFWNQANDLMEHMMWSGTVAIVVRVKNATVNLDGTIKLSGKSHIALNYISADKIIPLTVDNGVITEAAFCSSVCLKGENKIYLEIHRIENGEYVIENHLFSADRSGLTILCESELPEDVPKVLHTGSEKPWFSICRPATVNAILSNNGMGAAIFADSIDNLKGIDLAYNNLNCDIRLGQKKVFLSKSLLADISGVKIAPDDVNQQLFYYISEDICDDSKDPLIQEHNPELRISDNVDAIQAQLDYLSFKVGFGTKHYQFNAGSIVTATQYTGDKQDLMMSAHKHFIKVETFLHNLIKSILWIGHTYIDASIKDDANISITFDQSPLIDETAERERDRQDVHDKIMSAWEYRAKWYGESEAQARKAIDDANASDAINLYGGDFD